MIDRALVRVLLTGDWQAEEFALAVDEMKPAVELITQPSVTFAADWLQAGEGPVDLIVVAQSRPGQIGAAEIESLRRAAPLAAIVGLLGSWCEGEMRSGLPWPGVPRLYWHQWPTRFAQEAERLAKGEPSAWTLLPTATPEERLLARKVDLAVQGVAAVISPNPQQGEWLAAACRQAGLRAVCFHQNPTSDVEGIDVVLWDAGLMMPGLIEDFQQLAACFIRSPVLALLDFPRSDDIKQLLNAGAAAVLAKPILVADLISEIRRLLLLGNPQCP